jgi:mRNA-degrading endonuclease RelE of RelBE toxin-antitoxin system
VFEILVTSGAEADLRRLKARDRRIVVDAIESQLAREPQTPTRNRKVLVGLRPPWDAVPPVWELRVGDFRVFYDVDAEDERVWVRAVLRKPPHRTTEDIL